MSILKTNELKDLADKHIAFMSELQTGGFPYDATKTYNTGVGITAPDSKGIMTQFKSLTDSNVANSPSLESLHTPVNWEEINAIKTYDSSVTYTVGTGGDFTLLSDAISYASKMVRTDALGNAHIELQLVAGYKWTEQIRLIGQDLGNTRITSVDSVVRIDDTGWASSYTGYWATGAKAAMFVSSGSGIVIDFLMNQANANDAATVGYYVVDASLTFRSGAGCKKAGDGLGWGVMGVGSKINGYQCDFTGCHVGLELNMCTLSMEETDFNNCTTTGIYLVNCQGDASGSTFDSIGTNGATLFNSTVSLSQCAFTGIGSKAIELDGGSYVIDDTTISGCSHTAGVVVPAISVDGCSLTMLSSTLIGPDDPLEYYYGIQSQGSTVSLIGTNISDFMENIYCTGSTLSVESGTFTGAGECAIWCDGSSIKTNDLDFGDSEYGLYAETSSCHCLNTTGIGCPTNGFEAYGGSTILVTAGIAGGCDPAINDWSTIRGKITTVNGL